MLIFSIVWIPNYTCIFNFRQKNVFWARNFASDGVFFNLCQSKLSFSVAAVQIFFYLRGPCKFVRVVNPKYLYSVASVVLLLLILYVNKNGCILLVM